MALLWRIWIAVASVNAVVLGIFVTLSVLQFATIHTGLVGERLSLLAVRMAEPFQQTASLGLGLTSVRNMDGMLERARQGDSAISAIHLFDPSGRILRSTHPQPPPEIPEVARAARSASRSHIWHIDADDQFFSGIDIVSRTGASVGGILIVYSAAARDTRVRAMTSRLILAGLGVLLASVPLGLLLLRAGIARQIRSFSAIEEAIDEFEAETWRTAAGAEHRPLVEDDAGSVRGLLEAAEAEYRNTGRAIAATGGKP